MSLMIWLPLNGTAKNQGSKNIVVAPANTLTFHQEGIANKSLFSGGLTITAQGAAEVFNNTAVSIAFWIKPLGTSSGIIFGNDAMSPPNNRKFSLYQYPTGQDLHWSWQNDDSSSTFIGGVLEGVMPRDAWTHICVTYENPTAKIYINGILRTTATGVSNSTFNNATTILHSNPNRYINDLRVYNHCLSQKEVTNLSRGLLVHYDFGVEKKNLFPQQVAEASSTSGTSGYWNGTVSVTTQDSYPCFAITNNTTNTYGDGVIFAPASLIDGETYTVTGFIKCVAGYGFRISVRHASSGGYNDTVQVTSNGGWQPFSLTFTKDSSDSSNIECVETASNSASLTWYMRDLSITQGKFGGRSKVVSGNLLADFSGNSNRGTISNYTTVEDAPVGCGSLSLIASNSTHIKLPSLYLNESFSIGGWVKWTSFNTWSRFFDFGTATEGSGYAIGVAISSTSGTLTVFGRCGSGTSLPDTNIMTVSLNTWYHIFVTISGTALKVYVNGELKQSFSTTSAIGKRVYSLMYIGKSNWAADPYPNMLLSRFQIYNTALSAESILELYKDHFAIDKNGNLYCENIGTSSNSFLTNNKGITNTYSVRDASEYIPLSYIEATGSQYIKTGVVGPAIWEYDIQYTNTTKRQLMGHGGNGSEYWGITDGVYGMSTWSKGSIAVGNRDIFRVENLSSGRKIYINGVYSHTEGYDTRCESNEAQIFTIAGLSDYCNSCKLYGCKCFIGGNLIHYYIPSKRASDNKIGLYDVITNTFYPSNGSSEFVAGSVVIDKEVKVFNNAISAYQIYPAMGAAVCSLTQLLNALNVIEAATYTLSISTTNTSVSVYRSSSPQGGADVGYLSTGAVIYQGDTLQITSTPGAPYNQSTFTVNGSGFTSGNTHTVSGNVSIVSTGTLKTFTITYGTMPTNGFALVNRVSSPYGGGTIDVVPNGSTLYYGDIITASGGIIMGTGYVTINGIVSTGQEFTVTSNITVQVLQGTAPGGGSSGGTTGEWVLTRGTFYEGMSARDGFSVPSGLQSVFSRGCKISGTIYWSQDYGGGSSSSFSNVSISGGSISWGGGTVRLNGYVASPTGGMSDPYLAASGTSGTVYIGGMIGNANATVTQIVVNSYTY